MPAAAAKKTPRQRLLATVHIAAKELGLSEEVRRDVVASIAGVYSCAELNDKQLRLVVARLEELGWKGGKGKKRRKYPGRPHNMKAVKKDSRTKQLEKVEAYLAEAGRPWTYADALAQKICGVEKVVWVEADDLFKIITALKKDAERHGREPK